MDLGLGAAWQATQGCWEHRWLAGLQEVVHNWVTASSSESSPRTLMPRATSNTCSQMKQRQIKAAGRNGKKKEKKKKAEFQSFG